MTRLEVVTEREVPEAKQRQPEQGDNGAQMTHAVATKMLMMALQALSQKFIIAMASLFTLVTAASAFYLWMIALPDLDVLKIVGLSIYSIFVLVLNIYGRRK